jgi:abortive infection bacteriophage resistance protein
MPEDMERFDKPALTLDQQLDLLVSRGLSVPDRQKALHYLRFIGYYRLSGYCLPFQHDDPTLPPHAFRDSTTFDTVLNLYIFDRELRLLVMDAIERVEVAVRVVISNTMSERHGPHWFMDRTLFQPRFNHDALLKTVKDQIGHQALDGSTRQMKRETFIQHYYSKYRTPELPPSWMIAETTSIGTWSIMFANIRVRDDQKTISRPFNLHYTVLASWLHAISYLRNLCAHHSRLWNRQFTIKPVAAKQYERHMTPNTGFATYAAMLHIFMNVIAPDTRWQQRLFDLLNKNPRTRVEKMGFRPGWEGAPFWNIKR